MAFRVIFDLNSAFFQNWLTLAIFFGVPVLGDVFVGESICERFVFEFTSKRNVQSLKEPRMECPVTHFLTSITNIIINLASENYKQVNFFLWNTVSESISG